jgi:hypothetical protein
LRGGLRPLSRCPVSSQTLREAAAAQAAAEADFERRRSFAQAPEAFGLLDADPESFKSQEVHVMGLCPEC